MLHHPKETCLRQIAEREASARPVVDGLAEQHARLKRDGNALTVALDDIVNGSRRASTSRPGRAYIAAFRGHIDREEVEILPLAAKLPQREDWAAIDAAILDLEDPVFGKTSTSGMRRCAGRSRPSARFAGDRDMKRTPPRSGVEPRCAFAMNLARILQCRAGACSYPAAAKSVRSIQRGGCEHEKDRLSRDRLDRSCRRVGANAQVAPAE